MVSLHIFIYIVLTFSVIYFSEFEMWSFPFDEEESSKSNMDCSLQVRPNLFSNHFKRVLHAVPTHFYCYELYRARLFTKFSVWNGHNINKCVIVIILYCNISPTFSIGHEYFHAGELRDLSLLISTCCQSVYLKFTVSNVNNCKPRLNY